MNEATYERKPYFATLTRHMGELAGALTDLDPCRLMADGPGVRQKKGPRGIRAAQV